MPPGAAVEAFRKALSKAEKVAVLDRNCSFGAGGIFAQEVRAALYNAPEHPPVADFLLGFPYQAVGGIGYTYGNFNQWQVMPYLQDDWKRALAAYQQSLKLLPGQPDLQVRVKDLEEFLTADR